MLEGKSINKELLRNLIINQLQADHALLLQAAKTAHVAATHDENVPDNKYATLGLEASYLAQGQANRAQDVLQAISIFSQLTLRTFSVELSIRLTAVVKLKREDGENRVIFLVPTAGGLIVHSEGVEIMLVTPASPLGKELLGKQCGDLVELKGAAECEYEILSIY